MDKRGRLTFTISSECYWAIKTPKQNYRLPNLPYAGARCGDEVLFVADRIEPFEGKIILI